VLEVAGWGVQVQVTGLRRAYTVYTFCVGYGSAMGGRVFWTSTLFVLIGLALMVLPEVFHAGYETQSVLFAAGIFSIVAAILIAEWTHT